MHNLSVFLQRYNYALLFVVLEAVSLTLLFQHNSYQGSVWFTTANTVSGKVYEMSSAVTQYFALTQTNERLTARNVELERQVQQLAERLSRFDDTRTAEEHAAAAARFNGRVIAARVISNTLSSTDNIILLDKGAADGVRPNMGVVSGNGIVGIVYQTTPHYASVISIISSQSGISCRIAKRGYFGYLRWRGRSSRIAYLEEIPRHAHFKLYDRVETSGYSSVFPPGIQVGKILHNYTSPDGLTYYSMVELSTDFGHLRDVAVIDDQTMRDRLSVLRAAEDSLKIKKEE